MPPAPGSQPPGRLRTSFAGRLGLAFLGLLLLTAALAASATLLPLAPWLVFLGIVGGVLPVGLWLIQRALRPLERTLQGLKDGILSFQDRDFSVRLKSDRHDELGDLARLYNRVGELLLDEHQAVRQKELLLQTALDRSPAAIVLINPIDRIIYSNREARALFLGGSKLEGRSFAELREGCPAELREILASERDGIFAVEGHAGGETYHLSQRVFQLNRRRHTLLLLRRMTAEIDRQEAEIWKRVIRVISHELNNALTPISSLVHSARRAAEDPRHADRQAEIFATIQDRFGELKRFIEGYARFARLPRPQREAVDWQEFVASLADAGPFSVAGRIPSSPGHFDPAQLRQVFLNLIKNAVEASDGEPRISLRVKDAGEAGVFVQVVDRGRGMDEDTLEKALLPFYSTKKTGSGLGLPLCREILEAHGGRLSIQAEPGAGTTVTCWLPPA